VLSEQPRDRPFEIGPSIGVVRSGETVTNAHRVVQTFLQPVRQFIDPVDRAVAHQFVMAHSGSRGENIGRHEPGLFKTGQVWETAKIRTAFVHDGRSGCAGTGHGSTARTSHDRHTACDISLPSHVIGLGGRMGTRAIGIGATARAWARGPLGVQIEAGQSTYTSAVAPDEQLRSMQLAPSLMYSPPNLVTYAIWARPYIGAGITLYRSTLRSTLGGPVAVDNSFGSQVFGGAELTWANLPQFALSADFREQWALPTFTGFELGGRGVSLSAHWYLK